MSCTPLNFLEPFFSIKYFEYEEEYNVGTRSIILNLSEAPDGIDIKGRPLGFFRSTVVTGTRISRLNRCILVEDFDRHSNQASLFDSIKRTWPIVYEATRVERHKGVQLYRSPKCRIGNAEFNMCYVDSIPLNVGLHRTHWGDRPFREVHTQILGFGKMQQCAEKDLGTLYREDFMAPGVTHEPMYDSDCLYPWHQYEPLTKGIFMAMEMQTAELSGA